MLACAPVARAEKAVVAVAANFLEVAQTLAPLFEQESGHAVSFAVGSTGKLYAQILHGAPFDVLLAADRERPSRLVQEGPGVPGTQFTYAIGILTLWSADAALLTDNAASVLASDKVQHVAMADPALAPYGLAAQQVVARLPRSDLISGKIVLAPDIGGVFTLVATGNAQAGFVALSSVLSPRNPNAGSRWDIPANLYAPVRQDAVLLRHGERNAAAIAFLSFLRSPAAQTVIRTRGYRLTTD